MSNEDAKMNAEGTSLELPTSEMPKLFFFFFLFPYVSNVQKEIFTYHITGYMGKHVAYQEPHTLDGTA